MSIKIETANWSLRQYRNFMVAAQTGDFDSVVESLTHLVTEWDYGCDPTSVDCWLDNLNLDQWNDVVKEVTEKINTKFNSKN